MLRMVTTSTVNAYYKKGVREGYLEALKDVSNIIANKINECEKEYRKKMAEHDLRALGEVEFISDELGHVKRNMDKLEEKIYENSSNTKSNSILSD